jgi:16S rRNA (guanine527-N7)-methyltransferase
LRADKLLIKGLKALDLAPTEEQVSSFMTYLEELKRWSRAMSLTSLKTDEDIVIKHFIDSCLYLKVLPRDVGSIADVGSGAGFPGIPLKILRPEFSVCLIESSGKKCSFLRHIQRTLKIDGMEVVEGRVEDVEGVEVDAALTRATFAVEEFIKSAAHIVKEGGVFVLSKGPKVREELKGADFNYEIVEAALPMTDIKRNMVVVRKDT